MTGVKTNFKRIDYGLRIALGSVVMGGLILNVGPTAVMAVMTLFAIPAVLSGFLSWNSPRYSSSSAASQHKAPVLTLVPRAMQCGKLETDPWRHAA